MDNVLNKLITLVEKGTVEHRCAALLTLGALKFQNSLIVKTVGAGLGHSNPVLKDFALRYFEEVEPKAGVPLLLKLLEEPDKEIRERATRLLSRAGHATVQPLLQRVPAA